MKLLRDNASVNIKDYKSQTHATKLDFVDKLFTRNEIYKQAVPKLVETLDEVEADRDLKAIIIIKIKMDFGIKNYDYIRKHILSVVMTETRKHARTALISHSNNKYESQILLNHHYTK